MTLALFTLAKNEAHRLPALLAAARPWVDETIVLADVDSRDDTLDVARTFADRVYPVRFADSFGDMLTMGLHLCRPHARALWLDPDEAMLPAAWQEVRDVAKQLTNYGEILCLRRRRWLDAEMTVPVDPGNPDWSPRLLPVASDVRFRRRLHPEAIGRPHAKLGGHAIIEHFQDLKTEVEWRERAGLYRRLAALDGVAVEGGQPLEAPCRCGLRRRDHAGAKEYATPPFRATVPGVACGGFVDP